MATQAQMVRQETRVGGKYSKLNPCDRCGKSAGADYYSDSRCDWAGIGIVLCKKCHDHLATLKTDDEYLDAFGD